jgi:replicative DNA helicase
MNRKIELERNLTAIGINHPERLLGIRRSLQLNSFSDNLAHTIIDSVYQCFDNDIEPTLLNICNISKAEKEISLNLQNFSQNEGNADLLCRLHSEQVILELLQPVVKKKVDENSDVFEILDNLQKFDVNVNEILSSYKREDKLTMLNSYVDYLRKEKRRFSTGIPTLDRMLKGGLPAGGYSIVGGKPGAGKSSFMLSLALHMVKKNFNVQFIEGEMPPVEIFERMNGIFTGKPIDSIRSNENFGDLTEPFLKMIHSVPFSLVMDTDRTMTSLLENIKHCIYKKAEIIFIDYLQVFAPRDKADNEFSAIKMVSEAIRKQSLKHNVHICIASAYTREGKFYGSALLENDATQLFRLNYDDDDFEKMKTEYWSPFREVALEVSKNRGGARGIVNLNYELESQRITEKYDTPKPEA